MGDMRQDLRHLGGRHIFMILDEHTDSCALGYRCDGRQVADGIPDLLTRALRHRLGVRALVRKNIRADMLRA